MFGLLLEILKDWLVLLHTIFDPIHDILHLAQILLLLKDATFDFLHSVSVFKVVVFKWLNLVCVYIADQTTLENIKVELQ